VKLWTPHGKQNGDKAKAASITQRGTVALNFDYKGRGLTIEVTPKLAARIRDDLSACLEALEFERRRQGEYEQFRRDVLP